MENKEELEKLVDEFYEMRDQNGTSIGEFILKNGETVVEIQAIKEALILTVQFASDLADKQGYMRALKEVEDALPKEQEMIDGYADELIHGVASWNSCLSQAHDAISKLKEK